MQSKMKCFDCVHFVMCPLQPHALIMAGVWIGVCDINNNDVATDQECGLTKEECLRSLEKIGGCDEV